MGRLIDADKLKEVMQAAKYKYENVAESFFSMGGYLSTEWWCVEDMVNNAETVEAIPVDWIEAKMQWLREHNGAFYDPAYFLETMLKEWKEEQQEAPHCNADYCEIGGGE